MEMVAAAWRSVGGTFLAFIPVTPDASFRLKQIRKQHLIEAK